MINKSLVSRREILGAAIALPLLPYLPKIKNHNPNLADYSKLINKAHNQNILCYDSERLIDILNNVHPSPKRPFTGEGCYYNLFLLQNTNFCIEVNNRSKTKNIEFITNVAEFNNISDCAIPFPKQYLGCVVNTKNNNVMMFAY